MTCATCGLPTDLVDADPCDGSRFSETWECANGHRGHVRGHDDEPAAEWQRTGAVFNERTVGKVAQ
jgi:hypothetical protein